MLSLKWILLFHYAPLVSQNSVGELFFNLLVLAQKRRNSSEHLNYLDEKLFDDMLVTSARQASF